MKGIMLLIGVVWMVFYTIDGNQIDLFIANVWFVGSMVCGRTQ